MRDFMSGASFSDKPCGLGRGERFAQWKKGILADAGQPNVAFARRGKRGKAHRLIARLGDRLALQREHDLGHALGILPGGIQDLRRQPARKHMRIGRDHVVESAGDASIEKIRRPVNHLDGVDTILAAFLQAFANHPRGVALEDAVEVEEETVPRPVEALAGHASVILCQARDLPVDTRLTTTDASARLAAPIYTSRTTRKPILPVALSGVLAVRAALR